MIFLYVKHHWFQLAVDAVAIDNAIVSGARAAGWTKLETVASAIGKFINGMLKGQSNESSDNGSGSSVGSSKS